MVLKVTKTVKNRSTEPKMRILFKHSGVPQSNFGHFFNLPQNNVFMQHKQRHIYMGTVSVSVYNNVKKVPKPVF